MITKHTQQTIDQIQKHPTDHNLEWRDIRKMFEEIGQAELEDNGNLKVSAAGKSSIFQSYQDTNIATEDEIQRIRAVIHDSKTVQEAAHHLLVIDHKSAKLYQTATSGSEGLRITPFDPTGHKGHVHSKHASVNQPHQADQGHYFAEVAMNLSPSIPLLIFGDGHGSSGTMDSFVVWLKEREPKIADQILDQVKIDLSHLSEGEILEMARDIFTK